MSILMTGNSGDLTILDIPASASLTHSRWRLYYFQGNFFYPLFLTGGDVGKVKGAIRKFKKKHKNMIACHRALTWYKTKLQLFDEQMEAVDDVDAKEKVS